MTNTYKLYKSGTAYMPHTVRAKKQLIYENPVLGDWVSPTQGLAQASKFLKLKDVGYAPLPKDSVQNVYDTLATQESIRTDPNELATEVERMRGDL